MLNYILSTPPFLFKQSFTNLRASVVSSHVVDAWILRRCLLTENPLSGSPLPCERINMQFTKDVSFGNFLSPSSPMIAPTLKVKKN